MSSIVRPRVGFEVEGYIVDQRGQALCLNQSQIRRFSKSPRGRIRSRFHLVDRYMLEGKTFKPDTSSAKAAADALENIERGVNHLRSIISNDRLRVLCDSKFYNNLNALTGTYKADVGTHVHVDTAPSRAIFEHYGFANVDYFAGEALVYVMRRQVRKFVDKYCYSGRLRRLLMFMQWELGNLYGEDLKHTIHFRPRCSSGSSNSAEIVIPDSTDDIDVLEQIGLDAQSCMMEATQWLLDHHEGFELPDFGGVGAEIRQILSDYIY